MSNDDLNPERVGQYYDEWTPSYLSWFGRTFQACRPGELDQLHRYIMERSRIRDGERILDAGCGVCGPSIYLANHRDITIDAVTVSQTQVATARQFVTEASLGGRIQVHLADFHKLHELFPEQTFDRVLFLESLSHAPDPTGPLQSAFRVLRPGGVVYIKDFFERSSDNTEQQKALRETIERVNRSFCVKTPSLPHTVRALSEIGFRKQLVQPVGFANDISVWAGFNRAHHFDLYNGKEPFEWSDWIELRFEKPKE